MSGGALGGAMDEAIENGGAVVDDVVRCPSCGRIMQPAATARVGLTFPGELCLWCVNGHTPGNEAGWLPAKKPNARFDTWLAYRSMTRPDRVGADGTITLHCPPVPRICWAGRSVAIGVIATVSAILNRHGAGGWPAAAMGIVYAFVMVVIGVRLWRARILIRPDRLEMRGMIRSSVVLRSEAQRVGIEYWSAGKGSAAPEAAIQLRDGRIVIPPVTVQLPRRAVLALFDLLAAWVAEAEGAPSGEGQVSDAQRDCC